MFNKPMIEKIVEILTTQGRDNFTLSDDQRYRLNVFDREDKYEVSLEHNYTDRFNLKVENIFLENFYSPKGEDLKKVILEMLNERGLLVGGHTK